MNTNIEALNTKELTIGDIRSEIVGRFVKERIEAAPGEMTQSGLVFNAYLEWNAPSGLAPMTVTAFGHQMNRFGFEKVKGRLCNLYVNIRLKNHSPQLPGGQN